MTEIQMGITAHELPHQDGDIRLILATEEYLGSKMLRVALTREVVSNQDAKRILTELRDLADRALVQLWPEDAKPTGRHTKGRNW